MLYFKDFNPANLNSHLKCNCTAFGCHLINQSHSKKISFTVCQSWHMSVDQMKIASSKKESTFRKVAWTKKEFILHSWIVSLSKGTMDLKWAFCVFLPAHIMDALYASFGVGGWSVVQKELYSDLPLPLKWMKYPEDRNHNMLFRARISRWENLYLHYFLS